MQAPDPIETIMARLTPPALSAEFKSGLDETIDKLATARPENVTEISSGKWLARSLIGGGIAAGIGAMFALFPADHAQGPAVAKTEDARTGSVLVSTSERVDSVTDVGMRQDSEGIDMHAVKFSAVRENDVRDEESGMVVKISQPREEILLMPVGSFDLKRPFQSGMVEAAALPEEDNGALRVVNVAEKSAESTFQGEGKATVTRNGEQYQVEIRSIAGDVIFEGGLAKDAASDTVPEQWRKRVRVLCRTLDSALDGNLISPREPKPRQAPPVSRTH